MANDLDLARRGPAQIDRVLVNPTQVRVEDGGQDTRAFLNQISQLSDTLGGVLAKRAAEQRQRDEAQMVRDAQLKAFNPNAFAAAVERGEAKEWEHPDFAIRYDAFKAQTDEGKLIEGFSAIDPNADDDTINTQIEQLRASVSQGTSAYLAAMGPILAEHETRVRARVGSARMERQNEEAYANFSASLNAGVEKALRAGDLQGATSFLNEQIAVAHGLGQSSAKTAKAILTSAEALVADHPALADFFDDYTVPGIGRLGDLAPGHLQEVADQAQGSRLAEQRAIRAEAREQAAEQSKGAQRQAWLDLLAGRTPNAETLSAASYTDPDFLVKWETKRRSLSQNRVETDPRAYTALTVRAAQNELTLDDLVEAHLGGQINQADFDRLSSRIAKSGGDDALKSPVYTKMLGDFRSKAAGFSPTALAKADPASPIATLDVSVRQSLKAAEQGILDRAEQEVIAGWVTIHESGAPPEEQAAAAQELRARATERAQAELNSLRFDPRFTLPLGTQIQPVPEDRRAAFDAVPNAAAVFQRLPQVQPLIETSVDPMLLERAEALYADGDTTPADLTPILDTLRAQLGLPPGIDDEAIVFALVQHLQP